MIVTFTLLGAVLLGILVGIWIGSIPEDRENDVGGGMESNQHWWM